MSNQLPYYYKVNLEGLSERISELTADHLPSLQIGIPPEFGGKEGIWTPAHLYVASVNFCFWATFLSLAHYSKLEFNQFCCSAKGKLEKVEGNGWLFHNSRGVGYLVRYFEITRGINNFLYFQRKSKVLGFLLIRQLIEI